jgi:hypothetical protein
MSHSAFEDDERVFLPRMKSTVFFMMSCRGRRAVNTKNWYRKETDLWAEFGKKAPFDKRFSSKHSVKVPAAGSTPSFGRRAVSRLEEKAFRNT